VLTAASIVHRDVCQVLLAVEVAVVAVEFRSLLLFHDHFREIGTGFTIGGLRG
jgi:hypothetical protein